jgi:hypothetical protein
MLLGANKPEASPLVRPLDVDLAIHVAQTQVMVPNLRIKLPEVWHHDLCLRHVCCQTPTCAAAAWQAVSLIGCAVA